MFEPLQNLTEVQIAVINSIRQSANDLRRTILDSCPGSPERTLAIRELELCVFRAEQSILDPTQRQFQLP